MITYGDSSREVGLYWTYPKSVENTLPLVLLQLESRDISYTSFNHIMYHEQYIEVWKIILKNYIAIITVKILLKTVSTKQFYALK